MGEEGGLYFPYRGAPFPNEPVSQYRFVNLPKTGANDRTHENDANALSWHKVNASFWDFIGLIQVNCFGMGYSRKNTNRGVWGHTFLKKPYNFFCFSLYPWKFQAKQSFTHGDFVKLYMLNPSEIVRPKNQDPWRFEMDFSQSPLEIPLCF